MLHYVIVLSLICWALWLQCQSDMLGFVIAMSVVLGLVIYVTLCYRSQSDMLGFVASVPV